MSLDDKTNNDLMQDFKIKFDQFVKNSKEVADKLKEKNEELDRLKKSVEELKKEVIVMREILLRTQSQLE